MKTFSHDDRDLKLVLEIKADDFLPLAPMARELWLRLHVNDLIRDLEDLHDQARRGVRGTDLVPHTERWQDAEAKYDGHQLVINEQEVMQDWEIPLMKAMADIITEHTMGDILEIGWGMGISATQLVEAGIASYTVVEPNNGVIEAFERWRAKYPDRSITLIKGRWEDVVDQLATYDGIFFDVYPSEPEDFREVICSEAPNVSGGFVATAAKLLRPGGIYTFFTAETNSMSREQQRRLFKYFERITMKVVADLDPPADCSYYSFRDMVVVGAIKAT